jgi:hypothetical protein
MHNMTTTENMQTPAAAPAAPVAAPKPPKIEQNGVSQPGAETTSGQIWAIANNISAQLKAPASRKSVMDEAAKLGMNAATVATQYARWTKFYGVKAARPVKEPKPPKEKKVKAAKSDATVEGQQPPALQPAPAQQPTA